MCHDKAGLPYVLEVRMQGLPTAVSMEQQHLASLHTGYTILTQDL